MTQKNPDLVTVNVAENFSRFPSGRTPEDSKYSGELFRERFLLDPLAKGYSIRIELDGPIGYGSSFLDEAFGGLTRDFGYSVKFLRDHIEFVSYDAALISEIWSYIEAE